jgi:hypothetical protein
MQPGGHVFRAVFAKVSGDLSLVLETQVTSIETPTSAYRDKKPLFAFRKQQRRIKDAYQGKCRVATWPTHQLLYLRLPKCGNSSVVAALPNAELGRLRPAKLSSSFEDWTTFTFVRNPWSRLVSTYRQKVAHGATTSRLREGVFEGFLESGIPVYTGISFEDFCELACSFPDRETEKHLQSQSYVLMHKGEAVVKIVGRVETIDEDWRRIAAIVGISLELPRLNVSNAGGAHYREYYRDSRLVNLVGDRYADDVANFDYDF